MAALRRVQLLSHPLEASLRLLNCTGGFRCRYSVLVGHSYRQQKLERAYHNQGIHNLQNDLRYRHYRRLHVTQRGYGKKVPFVLSDIGEGIREVVVKEWFVSEGAHVNQFDPICEVQSDKASVTITSRYDGVVTKKYYKQDETALVGDPLVDIELSDGAHDSVAADQVDDVAGSSVAVELEPELAEASATATLASVSNSKVLATPAVRRIAGENQINLSHVVGTGKDGRVLKEDVVAYISNTLDGKTASAPSPQRSAPDQLPPPPSSTTSSSIGEDTVVTLKGIRKAMAKSMTEALQIPHFGYYDEVNMSQLVTLRKQLKGSALLGDIPFSYMPVIIKATSLSLNVFPMLNSSLLSEDRVMLKAAHNIGFAMDSPDGLIVPNIKNVQNLTILEIAGEMQRLMKLGEQGKLGQNDITGGTFSLSNIGSIGGTYAKPVILPPQAAIGALGKIQALPRFDENDDLIKAHIMAISWSADHRIIEGAQMARFSNLWKSYLENPASLILNMK
ncbi:lipoamide acyltransferase component of branched-chain alpha-keto acid dehydrogenase complex, mitochondrial-like [Watersipora subatra]|uniref:lipoamide acyltransferase component of branched-chain alpha-keto acid dehydrogenase complex, mitochondrial-like n=1 Tax=Watersipora subatra TaxID=2589382 RepID=UPI00355C0BF6